MSQECDLPDLYMEQAAGPCRGKGRVCEHALDELHMPPCLGPSPACRPQMTPECAAVKMMMCLRYPDLPLGMPLAGEM